MLALTAQEEFGFGFSDITSNTKDRSTEVASRYDVKSLAALIRPYDDDVFNVLPLAIDCALIGVLYAQFGGRIRWSLILKVPAGSPDSKDQENQPDEGRIIDVLDDREALVYEIEEKLTMAATDATFAADSSNANDGASSAGILGTGGVSKPDEHWRNLNIATKGTSAEYRLDITIVDPKQEVIFSQEQIAAVLE
ncbi:hypothetical protein MMC07_003597 [Pseudocyphellaria aurata]|nr:hypothetical protein [Pseudocyphellaria aurata]